MKKLKDYLARQGIRKKISTVITVIIVAFLIAIAMSYVGSAYLQFRFQSFYKKDYETAKTALELEADVQELSKMMLWVSSSNGVVEYQSRLASCQESYDKTTKTVEDLQKKIKDKKLRSKLEDQLSTFVTVIQNVLKTAETGGTMKAMDLYNKEYIPCLEEVEAVLTEVTNHVDDTAQAKFMRAQYMALCMFVVVLVCSVVAIFLSRYFSRVVTKMLTEPMDELELAAEKLQNGELDITIEYQGDDEMGHLADAFRNTCETLAVVIEDLKYMMLELREGNFQVESKCPDRYVGAFQEIISDLNNMLNKQSDVLKQINEASEQVALGANQMAISAQGLAEGATEQAGVVQELTATIDDVTESVQESAKATQEAYLEARTYQDQAEESHREMSQLIAAMERISKSSKEIENIIGEIEEIASQTNLLSLNASIEAARAGEAGRGFAVVAEQIGKLANDSAESAVRTRQLIQNALDEIEGGNEITMRTQEALEQLVAGIEFLSTAVKNSSTSSVTYADTMKEMEAGSGQISDVVQNNSAVAEQTSATSQELSAQAQTLNDLTGQFRLR